MFEITYVSHESINHLMRLLGPILGILNNRIATGRFHYDACCELPKSPNYNYNRITSPVMPVENALVDWLVREVIKPDG